MTENTATKTEHGAKSIKGNTRRKLTSNWHTRNSVASPFSCNWPDLPSGVTPEILAEIERNFKPLQNVLGKRNSKNRKDTQKKKALEEKNGGKSDEEKRKIALRSQLAIGINEVTRSLEKGALQLVMVCRSAKPAIMTSHLCALSVTRGCPAIAVFNLSKILAPLLKMNTVMAIGFKKSPEPGQGTDFADLVQFVIQRSPPIHVPWLDLRDLPPRDLAQILSQRVFKEHKKQEKQGAKSEGIVAVVKDEPPSKSANRATEGKSDEAVVVDTQIGFDRLVKPEEQTECGSDVATLDEAVQGQAETRKRKLQEASVSLDEEKEGNKRTKVSKIPYRNTHVKQVKIISKVLKGKKKKKKKGKVKK